MCADIVGPPFGLDSRQLEILAKHGVKRTFRRHTIIINEGDCADAFYVILEGRVRIFVVGRDGKEITFTIQGSGEYFGEMALDGGPRSATIITLEPCRLLVVSREAAESFFSSDPQFAMQLACKLIYRVRMLTHRVKSLALEDVYERFARVVDELAVEQDGVRVIDGKLTQADIASRIGASREMVSRVLTDLKTSGHVSYDRRRIVIHGKLPRK